MRKCVRCGAEMKENCGIEIAGGYKGDPYIILTNNENKLLGLFGGGVGTPKAAICPNCGEVSIYLEDVSKL